MPAPSRDNPGSPSLLLALRHAARPDRARVAAYLGLAGRPAWDAYADFLAAHRAWIASLDRALAAAGIEAARPLPDGADGIEPEGRPLPPVPPARDRAQALGYLYVLEAFRLGCSVLARRARSGSRSGSRSARGPWAELAAALATVPPGEQAGVVQGAREAFSAWERGVAPWRVSLGLDPLAAHAADAA